MKGKVIFSVISHHFLAMSLLVVFSGFGLAKQIRDPLSETISFLYNPYFWFVAYGHPIICSSVAIWCLTLLVVLALCALALKNKTKKSLIFLNIGLFFLFSLPIILYWIIGAIKYCGE